MKMWQKITLVIFLLLSILAIAGYVYRESPIVNSLFAAANCTQSKQYGYYGFNSYNAVCNKAGRSTSCGGSTYCCTSPGSAWTLGACVAPACITEGKFATNAQKCCTGLTKYQETSGVFRCVSACKKLNQVAATSEKCCTGLDKTCDHGICYCLTISTQTCTGTCPTVFATCNSNGTPYCCPGSGKQWVKGACSSTPAVVNPVNPLPAGPVITAKPQPPSQKSNTTTTTTTANNPAALVGCYDYGCVSQAQGSLWGLVNCGIADSDGDMQLCDGKGRIGTCQAQKQCCPGPGQKWTTDMTACPVTQATLTVSPTDVTAGTNLTVTWGSVPGPSTTDWLALYIQGEKDEKNSADWNYVNSGTCSKTVGDGKASGTCTFTIPSSIASGTYELRLYSNNTYTKLATSNTFTIKGTATGECCACPSPTPYFAASTCNGPCMTSNNCPTGQVCLLADSYGWVCRNPACPSTSSCSCSAISNSPTPTPRTTKVSCDQTCTSTVECQSGYQCVFMNNETTAVCRNPKCYSSQSCTCPRVISSVTPTMATKGTDLISPSTAPVSTISGTPTPTGIRLNALPTPLPLPTPIPINPPLSITPFTDKAGKAPQKFTLTGTSDPFTEIVIQFNPDAVGQTTSTDAKGNWRYILTKSLTTGNKDLTVTARSTTGGETQVKQAFTVKSGGSFGSLFIGFLFLALIGGVGYFIYQKQMNDQSSLFSQFPPISTTADEPTGTPPPSEEVTPVVEEKPVDVSSEPEGISMNLPEEKPDGITTSIPEEKPPFSS